MIDTILGLLKIALQISYNIALLLLVILAIFIIIRLIKSIFE